MHAAALRIELRIREARSLKEKRQVVKSLTTHVGATYGVAVAEVDHLDKWHRTTIGIAAVAAGPGHVDRVLHTVRTAIADRRDVELLGYSVTHLERPE